MFRFNNDYNHGAHPVVLKALEETNSFAYGGYGLDEWCEKAADHLKALMDLPSAEVHFLTGGTQTNFVLIDAALRPYEAVLCADTGHIHVHESGSVERTGHKILSLPSVDGKITAAAVEAAAQGYCDSTVPEHISVPKLVYISFPTELGTTYSREELSALYAVCRRYDLFLFVDGARLSYGLGAPGTDFTLADLARMCDAFYAGGTKCGALFGEALVLTNPALMPHFRNVLKQHGAMLAKGWLLGLQFEALLQNDLYFQIGVQADAYAKQLREAFHQAGIPEYVKNDTNQVFVILDSEQMQILSRDFIFEFEERLDDSHCAVRFCTSWATAPEEIDALIQAIQKLPDIHS